MNCIRADISGLGRIFLSIGGQDYVIEVGGRRFRFEMHPYCGPVVLNRRGDPLARQPGPRHRLWTAVDLWAEQGRRVGADGLCVWNVPPKPKLMHLGGRHYLVIHDDAPEAPSDPREPSHG